MSAFHLLIHGRVQGVGYRAWAVAHAKSLRLSGWVRNRQDGTVEAVIHGTPEMLERMIADCREGPPAARVTHVVVADWTERVEEGFVSRPTV